jgi:hypothetical protein
LGRHLAVLQVVREPGGQEVGPRHAQPGEDHPLDDQSLDGSVAKSTAPTLAFGRS